MQNSYKVVQLQFLKREKTSKRPIYRWSARSGNIYTKLLSYIGGPTLQTLYTGNALDHNHIWMFCPCSAHNPPWLENRDDLGNHICCPRTPCDRMSGQMQLLKVSMSSFWAVASAQTSSFWGGLCAASSRNRNVHLPSRLICPNPGSGPQDPRAHISFKSRVLSSKSCRAGWCIITLQMYGFNTTSKYCSEVKLFWLGLPKCLSHMLISHIEEISK